MNSGSPRYRSLLFWLGLLLVTRIGLLIALGALTHAREFTDDTVDHLPLIRQPLQILLAQSDARAQFPPLLPFVETALGYPVQMVLGDFYAQRMTFILYEALAAALTWRVLVELFNPKVVTFFMWTWILGPMTWMTSAIMAQEEMISAVFMAAIILMVLGSRYNAAIALATFGVLGAKIYFLVPLFGLLVVHPRGWPIAVIPPAIVYGVETYFRFHNGFGLPLSGFEPPATMSVTFWTDSPHWFGVSYRAAKYLSMPMAFAAAMVPIVIVRPWCGRVSNGRIVHMLIAMLLGVFAFFYYISPEYYVFVVCGLMLILSKWKYLLVTFVMFPMAWAVNFFYGVHNAATNTAAGETGKGLFVKLYRAIFPFQTMTMRQLSLALFVVFTLILWVEVLRLLRTHNSPRVNYPSL